MRPAVSAGESRRWGAAGRARVAARFSLAATAAAYLEQYAGWR